MTKFQDHRFPDISWNDLNGLSSRLLIMYQMGSQIGKGTNSLYSFFALLFSRKFVVSSFCFLFCGVCT